MELTAFSRYVMTRPPFQRDEIEAQPVHAHDHTVQSGAVHEVAVQPGRASQRRPTQPCFGLQPVGVDIVVVSPDDELVVRHTDLVSIQHLARSVAASESRHLRSRTGDPASLAKGDPTSGDPRGLGPRRTGGRFTLLEGRSVTRCTRSVVGVSTNRSPSETRRPRRQRIRRSGAAPRRPGGHAARDPQPRAGEDVADLASPLAGHAFAKPA